MLQETLTVLRRQFLGLNRVLSTVMELVTDGLNFDEEIQLLKFAATIILNNHSFGYCTIYLNREAGGDGDEPLRLAVAVSAQSILESHLITEEDAS
jgi:hypothetical protein